MSCLTLLLLVFCLRRSKTLCLLTKYVNSYVKKFILFCAFSFTTILIFFSKPILSFGLAGLFHILNFNFVCLEYNKKRVIFWYILMESIQLLFQLMILPLSFLPFVDILVHSVIRSLSFLPRLRLRLFLFRFYCIHFRFK